MVNVTADAGMACEWVWTGKTGHFPGVRMHPAQILRRVERMAGHQISTRRR